MIDKDKLLWLLYIISCLVTFFYLSYLKRKQYKDELSNILLSLMPIFNSLIASLLITIAVEKLISKVKCVAIRTTLRVMIICLVVLVVRNIYIRVV